MRVGVHFLQPLGLTFCWCRARGGPAGSTGGLLVSCMWTRVARCVCACVCLPPGSPGTLELFSFPDSSLGAFWLPLALSSCSTLPQRGMVLGNCPEEGLSASGQLQVGGNKDRPGSGIARGAGRRPRLWRFSGNGTSREFMRLFPMIAGPWLQGSHRSRDTGKAFPAGTPQSSLFWPRLSHDFFFFF